MAFAPSRRALMANAAALSALVNLASCNGAETPEAPSANADALGDLDATGVAARIRAREISALEATDAAIARIQRVNPRLNFIAAELYESGRTRAAQNLSGPFAGVPTLIKDLLPLAGAPLRYGSRAFANNLADAQPPYTDALITAGLVPIGKSTTPEFGLTATTEPLLGGPTRNPWDPAHSSGGSSGGAAAAVASRAVPIAHASDGGGSIRIPSSCCGLVGLKQSRGRAIASEAPQPFPISVQGCVSRTVRDTAAWFAFTERTGADATYPPVGMVTGPSERRLRIGLAIPDARGREPDAEVRAAIEGVADLCRSLGHDVREIDLGIDGGAFTQSFILFWAAGAAEVVAAVQQAAPDAPLDQVLEPLTLDLAAHYQRQPEGAFAQAIGALRQVEAHYATLFEETDALLTPVLAKPPPPIGELSPALSMEVGFARVERYVGYTPLQNVAGAPAISLPLAVSSTNLPIGAHFSAAKGQERRLLELAYELELARPWTGRRPQVSAD